MQSCSTLDEIDQLIFELYESIEWFENASMTLAHFKEESNKDQEYVDEMERQFNDKAIALLEAEIGKEAQSY